MTLVAQTADGRKIVKKEVSGPTSYSSGGFTVRIDELVRIDEADVRVKTNIKLTDNVHIIDYDYSGNEVTVKVYRINVTAASPSAWEEVPDGTDISALKLEVVAVGS